MSAKKPGVGQPREGEANTPSHQKNRGRDHAHHIGLTPINTDVARAMGNSSIAASPNASTGSGAGVGNARQFIAATALYPTSIWSPTAADVTQSATMPTKAEWESFGSAQNGVNGRDFIIQAEGPPTAPLPGLGVITGNNMLSPSNTSTKYRYNQFNIPQPKTSPLAQDDGLLTSMTFPLMQHPFGSSRDSADQPRLPSKTVHFEDSENSSPPKTRSVNKASPAIDCSLNTGASAKKISPQTVDNDDDGESFISNPYEDRLPMPFIASNEAHAGSIASQITKLDLKSQLNEAGEKVLVFEQESHPSSWARLIMAINPGRLGEAFEGSLETLKVLNASHCTIEPGARLICIKTDYVDNVIWAIRRGQWCAMDKVGSRIMRLWNDGEEDKNPVYFIFSVNGQRSYCGLAQMTGPWTKGGNFEDWKDVTDGTRTFGSIPIVWKYVKNISFEWFKEIKHDHNSQPIVNMWNGMHFPHGSGLKVIETYITKAHFTNILAWRKDTEYKPFRNVANSSQLDPRLKKPDDDVAEASKALSPRTPWRGGRGSRAGGKAMRSTNWRQTGRGQTQSVKTNIRESKFVPLSRIDSDVPTHDGHNSPVYSTGQLVNINGVTVIVDSSGNHHVTQTLNPAFQAPHDPGSSVMTMPSQQQFDVYNRELRPFTPATSANMRGRGAATQANRGRGGGRGRGTARGGRGGMHNAVRGGGHSLPAVNTSTQPTAFFPPADRQEPVGLGIDLTGGASVNQSADEKDVKSPIRPSTTPTTDNSSVLRKAVAFANFVPTAASTVSPFAAKQLTAPKTAIRAGFQPNANRQHTIGPMPDVAGSPSHSLDSIHDGTSMQSTQALVLPSTSDEPTMHRTSTEYTLPVSREDYRMLGEDKKAKYEQLMNQKMKIDTEMTILAYEAETRKADTENWIKKSDDPWEYDPDWQSSSTYEQRHISPVRSPGGTVLRSFSRNNSISPESKAWKREENRRKRAMFQADLAVNREIRREVSNLVDSPEASVAGVASVAGDGETSSGGVALD